MPTQTSTIFGVVQAIAVLLSGVKFLYGDPAAITVGENGHGPAEGPRSGGPARRRLVLVLGLDRAMWQAVEGEGAQGVGLPALRCCELNSGVKGPPHGSRGCSDPRPKFASDFQIRFSPPRTDPLPSIFARRFFEIAEPELIRA